MALGDSLATLTGQRDRLARLGGQATYAGASDTAFQAHINDALSDALDRLGVELGDSKTFEREGTLNLVAPRTGTDGVFTLDDETFTSAASLFTTWGIAARDAITGGNVDGVLRVSTITNQTTLEMAQKYASATATAQAFSLARDEYALASEAWFVRRVWCKQLARLLDLVTLEEELARTGERYQTGSPLRCAVVAPLGSEAGTTAKTRLRVFPFPDAAYELGYTYQAVPTLPSADFATAPHLQALLYSAAAAQFCRDIGEGDLAAMHEAQYQRMLPAFRRRDEARSGARVVLGSQPALLPGGGWTVGEGLRTPRNITQ